MSFADDFFIDSRLLAADGLELASGILDLLCSKKRFAWMQS